MRFGLINILVLLAAVGIGYYWYSNYYEPKITYDYDIIVVGSGLAGLTAAYEANFISSGEQKILILEKEQGYGGNSMKATSGINILNSPIQAKNKIKDSFSLFYNDTIKSGKNLSVPGLVSKLVGDSTNVYDFFTNLKVDLSQIGILGGHSVARTHRPAKTPVGYTLTSTLYKTILAENKNTTFYSNVTVVDLVYNKRTSTVQGVIYRKNINHELHTVYAKSVILATGGFVHDFSDINNGGESLLKKYVPHLMKFPTTNGPQAQGLGVKMAKRIGAGLVDMDQVQLHPTGFVDLTNRYDKKKFLAPELIRGVGAIILNQEGKRFCNEIGTRDYVTNRILKNAKKQNSDNIDQYEAYMVLNQKAVDNYGPNLQFYIKKGLIGKYDNFKQFSDRFGIDYSTLSQTINSYNKNVNGTKDEFGKVLFPQQFDINDVVYIAVICPSIHYTMGGLKMSNNGEILRPDGTPIKGLFGAGEVTGGVHGGNRLGGNSLLECAVYGRRAARAAVENTFRRTN